MIKQLLRFLVIVCLIFNMSALLAKENVGQVMSSEEKESKSHKMAESCSPATSQTDLDINNVRTRLLAGGDMWWDLSEAKYEIPKVAPGSGQVSKHSIFAGALWIGGIDAGGQLKVAAQTYRQTGNDFWTGPLDSAASVDDEICSKFDKHWEIYRTEIDEVIADYEEDGAVSIADVPKNIREWPGRGNPFAVGANNSPLNLDGNESLAPFVDINGDGVYNPEDGDYPDVDGDQAIWWIYNDKGNIHTETGGEAIGLEIKATAFAFQTNDEINDMTFYRYNIENFSTVILDSVFFGQWVDPDLGNYQDDFVGCDTSRGLGICYNGDADDQGAQGYGTNPPIVGVDFFQGPRKYIYNDTTQAIEDSVRLGMSKFIYYNNDFTTIGNPEVASHFYGYLSGSWKNGSPVTFGGNGFNSGQPTDYMFPSDPSNSSPSAWSECSEGNTPADRRFLQSSGPFRLEPGAKNEVVVGVVWVRPPSQTSCQADFDAIRLADDKAQALYDNNFDLIDGPSAPDLGIRELDQEIIISIENYYTEETELYEEADPVIKSIIEGLNDPNITDSTYNFQGYILYQLKNGQVSPSEFRDVTQARPIFQVDIEDGVTKIVNFEQDQTVEAIVPELMVDGNDDGISHTLSITENVFATGSRGLVNNRPYYYSIVAYAYNNYIPYEPGNPQSQLQPYLEGRGNIKVYSAVPHITSPEAGGTILNSEYGDAPRVTRLEGIGNMHNALDLTEETVNEILDNNFAPYAEYKSNAGPISVKIYDPMKVSAMDFELRMVDTLSRPFNGKIINDGAHWNLFDANSGNLITTSQQSINVKNEQVLTEYGISITIEQVANPGQPGSINNGFIEATKEYADPQINWLSGISDGDSRFTSSRVFNWIRSGNDIDEDNPTNYADYNSPGKVDLDEVYEGVLDGTFGPAPLVGGWNKEPLENPFMPGRRAFSLFQSLRLDSLASVDLVFTSDKSKWTRCIVVETQPDPVLAEGGASKLGLRKHASLNLDGTYSSSDSGRSWFPGYAINVETGKRLNIIFGEDSWLNSENGDDMIWNPTSTISLPTGPSGFTYLFGGKHYIYISNTQYDEGDNFQDQLSEGNELVAINNVFNRTLWVTMPMLNSGTELLSFEEGLIPTETKVRLRVGKAYTDYNVDQDQETQPRYFFSTQGYAPEKDVVEVADSALEEIRAVPNPYYAYSEYEASQLDRRVKITNLPPSCTVTIYSTDGTIIRRFVRDNPFDATPGGVVGQDNFDTSLEWDLRNDKNVPIASGIYIIHVTAPGIGEKTIKWFGVMRPLDFDNF